MNKHLTRLFILFACFSMVMTSYAQNPAKQWGFGFGFSGRDFDGIPNTEFENIQFRPAFQVHLSKYLNKSFDVGLQGNFLPTTVNFSVPFDNVWDVDLLLKWKLINGGKSQYKAVIVPYLQAGAGYAMQPTANQPAEGSNFNIPVGLGFKIQTGTPVSLDFGGLYKIGLTDLPNYAMVSGGVTFAFGGGDVEEPVIPEPPVDTDGDGIADTEDDCPTESGIAQFRGCPDTDADGVADKDDRCPEVPGLISLAGCPQEMKDADGDGIGDDLDECPNVAGLGKFNGCPDTDGDGIMDKADDCPTVAGLESFKGCPDTDGDGIMDKEDDCPEIAGTVDFKGCADTDGDGIRDPDDKCPDVAGVAEQMGCPEIEDEVIEQLKTITKSVQFETGSAVLKASSKPILDQIVGLMAQYPAYSIKASGYTDSVGDAGKNLSLSEKRAAACITYLAQKGVDVTKMVSEGFGEVNPIADNMNRAGRAQNRRVEFELFVK